MGLTRFPNGLEGYPLIGAGLGYGWSPQSTIYFVDGTNGSDSNSGFEPKKAKATIKAAIDAANKMDVIYVMPKDWVSGGLWLGAPYTESAATIDYAKHGLAIVGIGHQGLRGQPYGVVWKDNSTSAQVTVNAPMCAFENLAFERSSGTSGQIYVNGNVEGTSEGALTTIYNCHFHYGRGSDTGGDTGGAVYVDGAWGTTVDHCSFLGCLVGISMKSNAASTGNMVIRNNIFMSRLITPSDISADIYIYTQGSACIVIDNNEFAHLLPTGGMNRFISVQADVRQGIMSNNMFGTAQGSDITIAHNGTGCTVPDNFGVGANYCNGKLIATT